MVDKTNRGSIVPGTIVPAAPGCAMADLKDVVAVNVGQLRLAKNKDAIDTDTAKKLNPRSNRPLK
jgi:hypothetical protein